MNALIVLLLVAVLSGAIVSLLLDVRRLKHGDSDQNTVLGAIRAALVAAAVVLCFVAWYRA